MRMARAIPVLFVLAVATARSQSPMGTSAPAAPLQVRPALSQDQLPAPREQDATARIKAEADKAQREKQTQDTQARGYWIDPSTGLMWAAKDNGRDITWGKAIKFCSNLRLAGYSDWRLPTIDELSNIYDGSGFAVPEPKGITLALAGRAKGGLLLTGNHHWSSTKGLDDRGHPSGYAWYFYFPSGKKDSDPYGYFGSKRALCIRSAAQ
jgi:hypothetical protein